MAGRHSTIIKDPIIDTAFLLVLKDHTAGDPQRDGIIWTDLSNLDIRQRLKEHGIDLGKSIVKKLLFKHGYKKRKIQRRRTLKKVENRNEQFEKIAKLKQEYISEIPSNFAIKKTP